MFVRAADVCAYMCRFGQTRMIMLCVIHKAFIVCATYD